jgi:hypothetical protein
MTKNIKTVLAVFVFGVGIVALLVFYSDYKTPVVNIAPNSLSGCYVSQLKQDVYTLILKSTDENTVTGKISFNNFEKDSSSGSFNGTFDNNILLGNYSFDSEGMHSNRQLIFKKVDAGFVEGFGEVKSLGDSEVFADLNKITYEPNLTFVKSDTCTEQYIDSTNIFNFNYNPFFKVIHGQSTPSLDWRQNATKKGSILASVIIPRTYMPTTERYCDSSPEGPRPLPPLAHLPRASLPARTPPRGPGRSLARSCARGHSAVKRNFP